MCVDLEFCMSMKDPRLIDKERGPRMQLSGGVLAYCCICLIFITHLPTHTWVGCRGGGREMEGGSIS